MSKKVDMERRQHALEEGVRRGRETARKLTRLVELVAEGRTDAEISHALGKGFGERSVRYFRQVLGMRKGFACGGPWKKRISKARAA